ncbi:hypothetical protein [Ammoniphilus sp. 3BR4]|uniref:hypothetical protein n=1 Tax=Ammoniphilus sp. 3BR4 TaxID=3158265 RepID=UPI003465ABD2
MPVALFTALLVTVWTELAYTFKWWEFKTKLFPSLFVEPPFAYGSLLVGTIWIFHLTFRKFWLYLGANIVMDLLLSFPFNAFFEWVGLYRLVNYTSWHIFFTSLAMAIVIYGYQLWQEGVLIKPNEKDRELEVDFKKLLRSKEKAR